MKNSLKRIRERRKYRGISNPRNLGKSFENNNYIFKKNPIYNGRLYIDQNNRNVLKESRKSGSWKTISFFLFNFSFWTSYNRRYFSEVPRLYDTKNFGLGIIKKARIKKFSHVSVQNVSEENSLNIYSNKIFYSTKTAEIDEAFYLCINGSDQFQHFLQDCLPILTFIKKFLNERPQLPLIVKKPKEDFLNYEYFFELIDVGNPKIFVEKESLTINSLYFLDFKPINAIYCLPAELYTRMYEVVQKNKKFKKMSKKNLVCFIRDAKSRNFQNEEFIRQELSGYAESLNLNCFFINPSNISIDSVIEVLSNATYVFGAHGGAIYNMVFAPPSATLVEFVTSEHTDSLSHLVLSFGQNYMPYAVPTSKDSLDFSLSKKDFAHIFKCLES